jgi:transposase
VLLVNAAHVKPAPGRKTAKAAARWLAQLLRYGLLAARFMPPQGPRDVRDLTRYRTQLVQERRRAVNRGQGVLARATIKGAAVATDLRGVAGRAILAAWGPGRAAPATMAALAQGRMRPTRPLLEQALTGLRREHHRRPLTRPVAHSDVLDEPIDAVSSEIMCSLTELEPSGAVPPPSARAEAVGEMTATVAPREADSPLSFAQAVTVLDTSPGVDQRGAERLVAEWGIDMSRVGTASRLAAWTGVAPGKDASAGKRRAGKTRRGHRTLRTGLTQLAHAAARTKGTSLAAWDQRLATRRGRNRALMAVAHAIVVSAFHLLSRHEPYRELGANSCDEQRRHSLVNHLTRRLERLGYHVQRDPVPPAEH